LAICLLALLGNALYRRMAGGGSDSRLAS